jgi:ADP-heptose:LPS heptosyltransferase
MDDRVTLVRLHSLGDIVLAQPAATALAASWTVRFVTSEPYIPVVERMPGGIEPSGIPRNRRLATLSRLLRDPCAGRVLDLQGSLTVRLAMFPALPVGRFFTDRATRRKVLSGNGAMPLRSRDFATAAGVDAPHAPVLERRASPADGVLEVGMVVGGRWPMKSIPDGILAETARLLHDLYGARITLLGGAADSSRAVAVSAAQGGRPHRNRTGTGGVDGLIGDIERLHVLVSPDSGPAHVAAALGVPVLVLFTSTSPALGFWPDGFPGTFLAKGVDCRPCHRHGGSSCPSGGEDCRRRLIPWEIAERTMERVGR